MKLYKMKTKIKNVNIIINSLFFMFSVVLLLYPAIYNGYPLIHPDAGTYISSGFSNVVPLDRPIIYGLFVRHISLYYSLWLVIIAHAIIVTSFIVLFFKYFLKTNAIYLKTFILVSILTVFTQIGHFTAQIIPDIFASLIIIGFLILLSKNKLPKVVLLYVSTILIFSILSHLSHLALSSALGILLLIFFLIFRKKKFHNIKFVQTKRVLIIIIISWILLPSINFLFGNDFQIKSKTKNIILMARMIESGLAIEYLEDNCKNNEYELCSHLDDLKKRKTAASFVWDYSSPLYSGGCFDRNKISDCWKKKNDEYGKIIEEIYKIPKYRKKLLLIAITGTFQQLLNFDASNEYKTGTKNSPVKSKIEFFYSKEYKSFLSSSQSGNGLQIKTTNKIQFYTIIISFVLILFLLLNKKYRIKLSYENYVSLFLILLALFVNAFICATFSNVVGRYQARLIWLLPFFVITYFLESINIDISAKK